MIFILVLLEKVILLYFPPLCGVGVRKKERATRGMPRPVLITFLVGKVKRNVLVF